MPAHHQPRVLVDLELMLLEHRIDLIPEHSKVIHQILLDVAFILIFSGSEDLFEGQSPWKDGLVQLFEILNGTNELSVGDQVILLVHWVVLSTDIVVFTLIVAVGFLLLGGHFDFHVSFEVLVIDHAHDEVKVVLSLFVRYKVVQSSGIKIDSCALLSKDPLDPHEHLKDILWCHATIIIVITQFK